MNKDYTAKLKQDTAKLVETGKAGYQESTYNQVDQQTETINRLREVIKDRDEELLNLYRRLHARDAF